MVISLILLRCAKRFILPQKTKTSEKRVRSFQRNIIFIQSSKKVSLSEDDYSNKNHRLLGTPHSHQLWIVRKKKQYHIPDAASERV